ncbi:ABC transporter substrate-binding protein [Ureaplasma sp. ES3154-GEN]|uniref:ABC transporter substrate-binding protein n=1 Tax=Ureaplasma sp. ES3154-GEN TaxID=2984844 RepID=UPI0021E862EF|nr:ABC transporter substrate-binding protein [Ureaplasma sp. ES3154-GEN]MCV3743536.1 ABC transporter substrate-binding protein [Ureaplasma sp. ES3154-GEN]
MKIKTSRKKLWLTTAGVLSGLTMLTTIAASCVNNSKQDNPQLQQARERKYDFGIAIPAINSFNYLKFTSLRSISPTLISGFFKTAPSTNSKIGNILGLPKLYAKQFEGSIDGLNFDQITEDDLENHFNSHEISGSFYDLSSFGIAPETLASYVSDDYQSFITYNNKNKKVVAVKLGLNQGASKWSDGKEVDAQDFIDSFQYIMDLNTGSQLRTALLNINIKGSQRMNDVQEAYIRKHGVPYKNPFGRPPYIFDQITKEWKEDPNFVPFQNQMFDENNQPTDTKEVNDIKAAALDIGLSTGRMFWNITNKDFKDALSLPENQNLDLTNLQYIYVKQDKNADPVKFKLQKNPYFTRRQIFNVDDLNFAQKEQNLTNEQVRARRFKQVRDLANEDELLRYFGLPRSRFELLMEFETFAPKPNAITVVNDLNGKQELLPANRKFIETHGGIHNFGTNLDNFVYSSAFNIDSTILGPEGYITLSKNPNYYGADQTIPNNIKIYFNSKNEVKSLWFEQGIISATEMPTSYMLKFWSQEKTRRLMSKSQGFGTVAIQFNLNKDSRYESYEDYEANKDKFIPLLDPDLRRAISFATNRQNILLLTGWTSSFPVSNWTAFGVIKNSKGDNLELWFDNVKFKSEFKDADGKDKEFLIQNNSFATHSAKNYKFENINRTDHGFDPDVGRQYLNRFVKNHPEYKNKEVHLTFLYSTEPSENAKAAIAFKDIVERSLSNADTKVIIDLKALPPSTYVSYLNSGKFDITYNNLDKFAKAEYSVPMGAFFLPDGVNWDTRKTQGFELNPSGGWTFKDFFEYYKDEAAYNNALVRLGIPVAEANIIRELAYAGDLKTQEVYVPQWYEQAFARLNVIFKNYSHTAELLVPIKALEEQLKVKNKNIANDRQTHDQMQNQPSSTDYQLWHDYLFSLGRYANSLMSNLVQINAYANDESDLFAAVAEMDSSLTAEDNQTKPAALKQRFVTLLSELETANTQLEAFLQNDTNSTYEELSAKANEVWVKWDSINDAIMQFNEYFVQALTTKIANETQATFANAKAKLKASLENFTYLENDLALSKELNTLLNLINNTNYNYAEVIERADSIRALITNQTVSGLQKSAMDKLNALWLINFFKVLNQVQDYAAFYNSNDTTSFTTLNTTVDTFFNSRKNYLQQAINNLVEEFNMRISNNQTSMLELLVPYAIAMRESALYTNNQALLDKVASLTSFSLTKEELTQLNDLWTQDQTTFAQTPHLVDMYNQWQTLNSTLTSVNELVTTVSNLVNTTNETNYNEFSQQATILKATLTGKDLELINDVTGEWNLLVQFIELQKMLTDYATKPNQYLSWTMFNSHLNDINLLAENLVDQANKKLYKNIGLMFVRANKIKEASLDVNKAAELKETALYNINDLLLETDLMFKDNAFYQDRFASIKNKVTSLLAIENDQKAFFTQLEENQAALSKEFDISYLRGFELKNEAFPLFNYVISPLALENYYAQLRDLGVLEAQVKNIEDEILTLADNEIDKRNELLKSYEKLLETKLPLVQNTNDFANQKVYLSTTVANQNSNKQLYAVVKDVISQQTYTISLNRDNVVNENNQYTKENLIKFYGEENAELIWATKIDRVPFSFNIIDANLKPSSYSLVRIFAIDPRDSKEEEQNVSTSYKFLSDIVDNEIFTIKKEDDGAHRERIKNFFNSNRGGWELENDIFNIMRDLELMLRDQVGILPIMDTDTQWTIKSLGGISHFYSYYLQYAYDYNHPPRAGLPTSPEDEGE